jgi:hypothetical protein
MRYRADGSPDDTFGDHGRSAPDLGHGADWPRDSSWTARGGSSVVGNAASGTVFDLALVRYRADGTLDPAFDGDGVIAVDFHGLGDFGADVALDAAGRIAAAGAEFALVRALPGLAPLRTTHPGPSRST